MNYLKLFEEYTDSSNKTEEEKKEDIEDILLIEGIFDEWNLLGKEYFSNGGSMTYEFKLEPKGNKYLHQNTHRQSNEKRWYNEYYFDEQVKSILNRLNHSRLHSHGLKVIVNWTYDHDGYWEGGVYDGESKYRVDIWLSIIEPSWWKEKSIPYEEVSDKEAGII